MTSPKMKTLIAAACRAFEVSDAELLSHRRSTEAVRARQTVMWLAKRLTRLTLPAIGRHLGGRDHTTVIHGIRVTEVRIGRDSDFAERIARLQEEIAATPDPDVRESDPLLVAMDITSRVRRATDVSVEDIEGMARVLVGYGLTVGALVIDGAPVPEPELLPVEIEVPVAVPTPPAALLAAIDRVLKASIAFDSARTGSRERAAFEELSKALRDLTAERSNLET